MQRNLSDSFGITYDPLRTGLPSSRKKQVLQARGTVSMPTSPILRAAAGEPAWEGLPLTAAAGGGSDPFPGGGAEEDIRLALEQDDPFSPSLASPGPLAATSAAPARLAHGHGHGERGESQAYHNHPYPSTLFPAPPHADQPSAYYQQAPHQLRYLHHGRDRDGEDPEGEDEEERPRKKRAQVRIACTHCQKACKKCSNTRPCERCVKYGLSDCVDSTRKPRKTGVKRGPYKRRSSKYALSPSSASSTLPPLGSATGAAGYYEHPTHAHGPAPSHGLDTNASAWWSDNRRPSDIAGYSPPAYQEDDHSAIPPPRAPSLQSAFSAALSGPRWVNGQRVVDPHPATTSAFPLSLHQAEDPFSRAVSPIRQFPRGPIGGGGSGGSQGMYASPLDDPWNRAPHISPTDSIAGDMPMDIDMGPGMDMSIPSSALEPDLNSPWIGANPWDNTHAVSAPTSPRSRPPPHQGAGAGAGWSLDLLPRASSAEPQPQPPASYSAQHPYARFAPSIHSRR